MSIRDLVELSVFAGLLVLLLLVLASAVRFRPSRVRGLGWGQRLRRFGRHVAVRLPVPIAVAIAVFVLGAAALTLNSHRPPADNSPLLSLPARSGGAVVDVSLDSCDSDLQGRFRYAGAAEGGPRPPLLISDQDGRTALTLKPGPRGQRKGSFEISDPLARRGLLSCYLPLPVVRGAERGYSIHLSLPDVMEVDAPSSLPIPDSYRQGEWVWRCPAGETCPGFVTIMYSVEDGTKQVIVLVLAAVFGALIALLGGEVLIEWARRRFSDRQP